MQTFRIWFTVLVLSLFSVPGMAEEALTKEKHADILRLFEMTGSVAIGKQMAGYMATHMIQSLKKARPDIPQELLTLVPSEIEAVFQEHSPALLDAMVPIYRRHFTAREIKEMIRIYSSDLGRKMVKTMPVIMNESMALGQQWGQSLGPTVSERVRNRLKKEGMEI